MKFVHDHVGLCSKQLFSDHVRSFMTTYVRSKKFVSDHVRSTKIVSDHVRSTKIVSDHVRSKKTKLIS